MDSANLKRELEKIREALEGAVTYHTLDNEKNAALHCSPKVLYSPLTVKLQTAANTLDRLIVDLTEEDWT